jgi:transcriptional regulator with XRE-family HTH domain
MPKSARHQLNTEDPLSESTWHRRLWAARLRTGQSRRDFVKKLKVTYNAYEAWETGASVPKVLEFARCCELLGYTIDEILYGHKGSGLKKRKPNGIEQELSEAAIRALLSELEASSAQRAAVGELLAGPHGKFQAFTRTYVSTFIAAYQEDILRNASHEKAMVTAVQAATQMRATATAISLGGTPVPDEPPPSDLPPPETTQARPVQRRRRK